jgi:hypothetical protein
MPQRAGRMALAACVMAAVACAAAAQEKPLRRIFLPGAEETYRVDVSLRTEVRGVQAETIGAKSYVRPFLRAAEGTLHWTAVRRTLRVDAAGIAEIEESLDRPAGECPAALPAEEDSAELRAAVGKFCESWKTPRVLHYREENDGLIRHYPEGDAPELQQMGCALIQLWSRHAWRPSAILPAEALRIGQRHEKKSRPNLAGSNPGGSSEMVEWLPARGGAEVVLHVVQQFSSPDYRVNVGQGPGQEKRLEKTSFFAESLATLSTLDGSLYDSTRSAACETSRTLDAVEGLPDPPRFSSRLSVTVTIHRIP